MSMKLCPAQCPNCSAVLTVNPCLDAAICEYCGTPFIVEKAIKLVGKIDFEIVAGTLIKYNGEQCDVSVPEGVVSIGDRAFEGMKYLSSVYLPETVIEIGHSAFANCISLTKVHFPSNLKTLATTAFSGCANLVIPDRIKKIESSSYYCSVCGYVHNGTIDEIQKCPICHVPATRFIAR